MASWDNGERRRLDWWPSSSREYEVQAVLPDGNPEPVGRYGNLRKAQEAAESERELLRKQNYRLFFVGVIDVNDPERGWLQEDDNA
jgi:hypothetical protein